MTDGSSQATNAGVAVGESQSHSTGESQSQSLGLSATQSQEVAQSVQVGETAGHSVADGSSHATSQGQSQTVGLHGSTTLGVSGTGGVALGVPGTLGANLGLGTQASGTLGGSLTSGHSTGEEMGTSTPRPPASRIRSPGASASHGQPGVNVGVTQGASVGDTAGSSVTASLGASQGHAASVANRSATRRAWPRRRPLYRQRGRHGEQLADALGLRHRQRVDATMRSTTDRRPLRQPGRLGGRRTFSSSSTSQMESDSVAYTRSRATSVSDSYSVADTVSRAEGDAWSQSQSRSHVDSAGVAESQSTGVVQARSVASASGMGIGAGLSPYLSASKSYQWEDHLATAVADLLRGQERLLTQAAAEGAFWVDNYFLCRTERSKRALAALYAQAFHGQQEVVTPAQTRPAGGRARYIAYHAQAFTLHPARDIPGILEGYRDTSFLTLTQAAALVAPGCFEEGEALTCRRRFRPTPSPPICPATSSWGTWFPETGETTPAQCADARAHD